LGIAHKENCAISLRGDSHFRVHQGACDTNSAEAGQGQSRGEAARRAYKSSPALLFRRRRFKMARENGLPRSSEATPSTGQSVKLFLGSGG
jgi:hypothetical protein